MYSELGKMCFNSNMNTEEAQTPGQVSQGRFHKTDDILSDLFIKLVIVKEYSRQKEWHHQNVGDIEGLRRLKS